MMRESLAEVLRDHLGIVTFRLARDAGIARNVIERLAATDQLVRIHRGVFRHPAFPVTDDQRRLAAVLANGPAGVLSHRAATAHWGVPNFACFLLEVTKPYSVASTAPGMLVHRSRRMPDTELTVHRQVPITTPARTLIDLASVVGAGIVRMVMERWLSSGRMSVDSLSVTLRRNEGRPGQEIALGIFEKRILGTAEPDSPSEGLLGEILIRAGMDDIVHHRLVTVTSGATFELDWCFPHEMIALEMDGYGVHLRSLDAFENDRERRNELEIDSWTVINFTRRQVESRPHKVVDQVRRLRAARQGVSTFPQ